MKTIKELEKIVELLELKNKDIEDIDYIRYRLADSVFDYLKNTYYFNKDKGLNIFLEDKVWEIDKYYDILEYTNDITKINRWEDLAINVLDNIMGSIEPIATHGITNNIGVMIYDIEDGTVIYSLDGINFKSSEIYSVDDGLFFTANNFNIPLDECIKTNY